MLKNFKEIIGASAEALRETRVKNKVRDTAYASKSKIESAKQDFRNLQSKIEDHMDLGITSTTDIASNLKNFEPGPWCDDMYKMVGDLALMAADLRILVNVHNQLFPDEKVEGLSADDLEFVNNTTGLNVQSGTTSTEEPCE